MATHKDLLSAGVTGSEMKMLALRDEDRMIVGLEEEERMLRSDGKGIHAGCELQMWLV